MSFQQRKMLMKSFVEDQFGYYPLVFVFHGRELNRRINHIHERSLCIVYKDQNRNIQFWAIELFKVKENISNAIISDTFSVRDLNHNIRSQTDFFRNTVNTTKFILNSLKYFISKVCIMITLEMKDSASVDIFISNINKYNCRGSPTCNNKRYNKLAVQLKIIASQSTFKHSINQLNSANHSQYTYT